MRKIETTTILVAAKDAGGCNAVLPVLRLLTDAGFSLAVYGDGPALHMFEKEGLSPQAISVEESVESVQSILATTEPSLVLTGNSWGESIENKFIGAAKRKEIPSVGVLDSWLLYDEKFGDSTDIWRYLPDRLVVMDDLAKDDMVGLGAPPDRLIVLGQPQFDDLAKKRELFSQNERAEILGGLGIKPGSKLVLFLSQAMREFYGGDPSHPGYIGYTEDIVLNHLLTVTSNLGTAYGEEIALAIKLHPREKEGKFAQHKIPVVKDSDPYSLILSADLTVGMDTILLTEACLLGCSSLSYQPGLLKEDHVLSNRLGVGEFCYEPSELEGRVRRLLFDETYRQESLFRASNLKVRPGASERVYAFVTEFVARVSA